MTALLAPRGTIMSARLHIAAALCCACLATAASAHGQDLLASMPSDVGALPGRKSEAPEINIPFSFEALRHATHPGLRGSVLVSESVLRLVGKGFGKEPAGRTVMLKLPTSGTP